MIRLSVVIPTFNRHRILQRTLASITEQELPIEDYEVIVVDDGSTDDTAGFLRDWKPRYAFRALQGPHRGPSAARNLGIRAARGELVLFLDDDLTVVPSLFEQHCRAHLSPEPRVVHGPIYIAPGSSKTIIRHINEVFYESYYRPLAPEMELRYPMPIGNSLSVLSSLVNSSMPRDSLLNCEGFDEQVPAAEDLELGLRLWKMGLVFRYLPNAIAEELYVKSSRDYLRRQAKALGVGDLVASRKHPEYRQYSALSGLAKTRTSLKWLRASLLRFSTLALPLLTFPLRFEERFYSSPSMRRLGVRLLSVAERITRLRSAVGVAGSWKALEREFGQSCPSLLYHHVGPLRPGTYPSLTLSPKQFEQQIRWLARRGYTGILPSDWLRWKREGAELPRKPILLTFDDAYADTAEYALPILHRYGFPAAIFVVTGQLGGTNAWDEAEGCGTLQLMTAEQIRYWAERGIEFGAHSRTHADLSKLSKADCATEMIGSKNDLSALLGYPVTSFAYPYGENNDSARELAREEFDLAFSVEEGINYLQGDPHLLRRAYVGPSDSLLEFALCVRMGGLKEFRISYTRFKIRTRLRKALRSVLRFVTGKSAEEGRGQVSH